MERRNININAIHNTNINNNISNNKNNNIEKLSSTENDIMKLGDLISELLYILKDALEGNNNSSDQCKVKLKEIFDMIEKIKKNLHELVDIIYSRKNFVYLSKIMDDYIEKEKQLDEIKSKIIRWFPNEKNNIRQINQIDKNPFTVNKK